MSEKYLELFNNGEHRCISFHDLVSGDGIQSNQFLVIDNERAALIDPGGDLTFTALKIAISSIVRLGELDYVIASHQGPDIIASIGRWLMHSNSRIVASHLWSRFLPHLVSDFVNNQVKYGLGERIIALPDEGGRIPLGNTALIAVPAHFLHSVGNLQFYDPVSRILFSGDMGASLVHHDEVLVPIKSKADFLANLKHMEGFHKRYMCSNKVCRLWADMVRSMDVDMIVPQHGAPFKGKETIGRFLDWISRLECGIDLLSQRNYRVAG